MANSNTKTYFSDGDASPTPFNSLGKKKSNGKPGFNQEMVAAADTIQGLSQKTVRLYQKF